FLNIALHSFPTRRSSDLVSAKGFKQFAEIIKKMADKYSDGRLVVCHEGGYSAAYVPFCSLGVIEGMSGINTEVNDPFISGFGIPTDELYENQKNSIHKVIEHFSFYWDMDK